tara:strand:+ start:2023 stop:2241 length:219 start_codon:yes stop_codon:yes gene_type:complete
MKKLKIVKEFIEYVTEFYNDKTGIYPIATKSKIKSACMQFIDNRLNAEKVLYFDSLDREEVRCLLQPDYKIF